MTALSTLASAIPSTVARSHVVHLDRAEWESCAAQFRDHSYRQTWAYGAQLAAKRGAESEHVAVRCGGETIALADVRIKRLPVIGGGLAYISGGPLVRKLDSPPRSSSVSTSRSTRWRASSSTAAA